MDALAPAGAARWTRRAARFLPRSRAARAWLGLAVVAVGGWYVSHLERTPVTQRLRYMHVSEAEERRLAAASYREIMLQHGHRLVPAQHAAARWVRRVAQRLIAATGLGDSLKWEVHVIDAPVANAFVLPGGKIFVFTGLLPLVRDEAGMAAVLAHEMAHQVARHAAEKVSQAKLVLWGRLMMAVLFDPNLARSTALLDLGVLKPHSRRTENEADYIGLMMMAQACYDPKGAIGLWQRMTAYEKQQAGRRGNNEIAKYFSTHPAGEERIDNLRRWMPEAEQKRTESNCESSSRLFAAFNHIAGRTRW
ncbi:hypothetical protein CAUPRSCDRAFT_6002 [Caulochytrium protostelioides]|uniref:Peptidase M48 domain-containing protein n=1 Tax=Caulochytrium protostelioides TaxID=1555241 RepID=A0A4P9X1M7_9FUNG|nr:hypothetical protein CAUPRSCDRAFT_6002 [Caulochytrium protostelioides]